MSGSGNSYSIEYASDTGVLEVSGTADFEGHSDRVQIVTDEPAASFSFIVTGASSAGETFDLGGVCYLP